MRLRPILPLLLVSLLAFSTPYAANNSTKGKQPVKVADGWPPPTDCGLYDICRATESTATNHEPVKVADGWPPPTDCGLYDICRATSL